MKIALLEISHWHFPLYIEDLLTSGVDIIALSDKTRKLEINMDINLIAASILIGDNC